MQTNAFELEIFSIEPEAGVRFEFNLPDAERHCLHSDDFLAAPHLHNRAIHFWATQLPQLWLRDDKLVFKRPAAECWNLHGYVTAFDQTTILCNPNAHANRNLLRRMSPICHITPNNKRC